MGRPYYGSENFKNFLKISIIQRIFSNHNGIKLGINNSKKYLENPHIFRN